MAALALALAACHTAGAASLSPPPASMPAGPPTELGSLRPFFVPGESFTYTLTYAGIEGGRARLAVGQVAADDGHRVVVLRGDGESAGLLAVVKELTDSIVTWLDVDQGLPARSETQSASGKKLIVIHTRRAPGVARADHQVWRNATEKDDSADVKSTPLPRADTQDTLSAVLVLRSWRPGAGQHGRLYTLGGERVWRSEIVAEGSEEVDSPLGRRRALRLAATSRRMNTADADDPSKPPRQWRLWISDDAQRIPLRIEAQTEVGAIVVEVTSYEAP